MSLSYRRLLALAALSLAAAACAAPGSGAPDPSPRAADATAASMVVHRGDFEKTVLLTGELKASEAAELIVPRTPNWQVEVRWLADNGTPVQAGEKVVDLDNSAVASDLEDKEISLREKLSTLTSREAELAGETREKEFAVEKAQAELEKAQIRAKVPEGIVPRQELEDRRLALDKARSELAKAQADLDSQKRSAEADLAVQRIEIRKARREIDAARQAIDRLTLYAPRAGIFLVGDHPWQHRPLQVGDSVWAGVVAGTIPNLSSLEVEAHLPDVDDGAIAPEMLARVILDAYPDETFPAEVEDVAPVAQAEGPSSLRRHFRVRVHLDRTQPDRMIPGMSARVEVVAARRSGVLLAPRAALLPGSGGKGSAVLASGGTATVRLGPCNALECVLQGGLDEGTRLARRTPAQESAAGAPATVPAAVAGADASPSPEEANGETG